MRARDALKVLADLEPDHNVTLIVHEVDEPDSAVVAELEAKPLDELAQMLHEAQLNEVMPASRQVRLPKGVTREVLNDIIRRIETARG